MTRKKKPTPAATAAALALNEARTRKLTPKRRRDIAKQAAETRWAKRPEAVDSVEVAEPKEKA